MWDFKCPFLRKVISALLNHTILQLNNANITKRIYSYLKSAISAISAISIN